MKRRFPRVSLSLLFAVALFFLFYAPIAVAQPAVEHQESGIKCINYINVIVRANGLVEVEENIEVNNTIVKLIVPKDIQNVRITDSRGKVLDYDIASTDSSLIVSFYLKSIDDRVVSFSYITSSLTSKNGSTWTLRFTATTSPGSTIVRVDFPDGTEVFSLRPEGLYRSPKNLSDSMFLYPQTSDFSFEYDYRVNNVVEGKPTISFNILFVFLALFVVFFIVYSVVRFGIIRRVERRLGAFGKGSDAVSEQKEVGVVADDASVSSEVSPLEEVTLAVGSSGRKIASAVLNMLEENERKVVEVIENAEGEITQAYIYKSTGIPKTSLSDIIKRLEKRNILERRREGRTNWIKLKDWVFNE